MALSRVTVWCSGQVLTAGDLNGEFNNVLNNALSLISPLTGNLAFGGNSLTGLSAGTVGAPSLAITGDTDTGLYRPAADTPALAGAGADVIRASGIAAGVNYLLVQAAITAVAVTVQATGSDTNVNLVLEGKGTGVVSITDLAYNNVMLLQVFS